MLRRRGLCAGSVVAAVALTLAGCGGESGTAPGAPGEPLKVIVIGSLESSSLSVPQTLSGVQAAAAAINQGGGIGGRQVEVLSCNDKNDPNEAAKCAREAVDEEVIAVVGSVTRHGAAILPVLEAAGIADVGNGAISPPDYQNPVSFPLSGGTLATYRADGLALAQNAGVKQMNLIAHEAESARTGAGYIGDGFTGAGGTVGSTTIVPLNAADLAPQVAAAAQGAESLGVALSPSQMGQFLAEVQRQGIKIPVATIDSALPDSLLASLGPAAEGLWITAEVPPVTADLPYLRDFETQMKATAPDASRDSLSLRGWGSMNLLAEVLEGATGDITAETTLNTLRGVKGLDFLWLQDFSAEPANPQPGRERISNGDAFIIQIRNGQKVLVDGPVPVLDDAAGS